MQAGRFGATTNIPGENPQPCYTWLAVYPIHEANGSEAVLATKMVIISCRKFSLEVCDYFFLRMYRIRYLQRFGGAPQRPSFCNDDIAVTSPVYRHCRRVIDSESPVLFQFRALSFWGIDICNTDRRLPSSCGELGIPNFDKSLKQADLNRDNEIPAR
jgi:hypothetical protein